MDKHVNFYFQSLLSTIIYVFDILFNLPESRKLRKILPGFSTSRSGGQLVQVRALKGTSLCGECVHRYEIAAIVISYRGLILTHPYDRIQNT